MTAILPIVTRYRHPQLVRRRGGYRQHVIADDYVYTREEHEARDLVRRYGEATAVLPALLQDPGTIALDRAASVLCAEMRDRESEAEFIA